jgi:hypothetical protein
MPSAFRSFLILTSAVSLLTACGGESFLSNGNGDGDEDAYPEFDGATLAISSPVSAGVYLLDEGLPLEGEVLSADGDVLDFDAIVWETDAEGEIAVGTAEEADLNWGIKTVTATATLPNGDRLQTVLGGIRVQGRHTGIYAGNLAINLHADFQDTPITASCLGGLDFIVDMSGEVLLGEEGSCTINLIIMDEMDIGYAVEADVSDDSADGSIQINTGFIDIPVGFEGNFEDEQLYAEFEGNAFLFDFDGNLTANRLSLYVDP